MTICHKLLSAVASALASLVISSTPLTAGTTVLNFDKQKDGNRFKQVDGRWIIKNSAFRLKKFDNGAQFAGLHYKNSLDRAVVKFRFRTAADLFYVIMRFSDTEPNNSGYELSVWWSGLGVFYVDRYDADGQILQHDCLAPYFFVENPEDWHEMSFDMNGKRFEISLDGSPICRFVDKKHKSGIFGIGLEANRGTFEIDQFTVITP